MGANATIFTRMVKAKLPRAVDRAAGGVSLP
jgi:hypothetical protein